MFRKKNSSGYINERIVIEDPTGDHYIHLISSIRNESEIAEISGTILRIKED